MRRNIFDPRALVASKLWVENMQLIKWMYESISISNFCSLKLPSWLVLKKEILFARSTAFNFVRFTCVQFISYSKCSNWRRTLDVYLFFAILLEQLYQKLNYRLLTYKLAIPQVPDMKVWQQFQYSTPIGTLWMTWTAHWSNLTKLNIMNFAHNLFYARSTTD